MAITTMDGVVSGLSSAEIVRFSKRTATTEGTGTFHSLWALAGNPGAGVKQGSINGGIPTKATAGAPPFTNPGGSNKKYLLHASGGGTTLGVFILFDRLWHNSELVTNTTADQDITAADLDRPDANGAGVELWGEVFTAPGATGATWTVTYNDQDGNTGQSATYAHPANAETVGQMFQFNLASGDTGVRKVTRFKCSVSSGTAGNIGLVLLRRICSWSINSAGQAKALDAFDVGMPEIYADACLSMMVFGMNPTGEVDASFRLGEG